MRITGNTPLGHFKNKLINCTFRDLTNGKAMPRLLKSVLGLSHKFIVTPDFTLKDEETLEESLDRFCRDLYLKVYFADEPMDNKLKPPTFT